MSMHKLLGNNVLIIKEMGRGLIKALPVGAATLTNEFISSSFGQAAADANAEEKTTRGGEVEREKKSRAALILK